MESTNPIFAQSFDFCIANFFSGRVHKVLGEIMCLIRRPDNLSASKECGVHKNRIKQLLPETNTIIYYWNYGSVWEVVGVIENGNDAQLWELIRMLNAGKFDNGS